MALSTFTRSTGWTLGGVYTCAVCGKKTRETGEGESGVELCAYCYHEGGIENDFNDGHISEDQFNKMMADLKKRYNR